MFPSCGSEAVAGDSVSERIYGSMFVPVKEAVTSCDMFTSAAVGQLLVKLQD